MKKLRVLHYPQVPCDPFFVDVKNEEEAYLVQQTLADQHLFLFNNNFIDDYTNVISVVQWDDEGNDWIDFFDDTEYLDWDEYCDLHFR